MESNKKTGFQVFLGIVLALLIALMYKSTAVSLLFHEIAGLVIAACVILHLVLSRGWIARVTKGLFRRGTPKKDRLLWWVDLLLLLDLAAVSVTGVMISRVLFSFSAGIVWTAVGTVIHEFSAALLLILAGVHVGLHACVIFRAFRGWLHLPAGGARIAALAVSAVLAVYGGYSIATTSFVSWLSMPFRIGTLQTAGVTDPTQFGGGNGRMPGNFGGGQMPGGNDSSGSDNSGSDNSSGQTSPGNFGKGQMPGGNDSNSGGTTVPGNGGGQMPGGNGSSSGGTTVPGNDGGGQMPGGNDSNSSGSDDSSSDGGTAVSLTVSSADAAIPVADSANSDPSAQGGGQTPDAAQGQMPDGAQGFGGKNGMGGHGGYGGGQMPDDLGTSGSTDETGSVTTALAVLGAAFSILFVFAAATGAVEYLFTRSRRRKNAALQPALAAASAQDAPSDWKFDPMTGQPIEPSSAPSQAPSGTASDGSAAADAEQPAQADDGASAESGAAPDVCGTAAAPDAPADPGPGTQDVCGTAAAPEAPADPGPGAQDGGGETPTA